MSFLLIFLMMLFSYENEKIWYDFQVRKNLKTIFKVRQYHCLLPFTTWSVLSAKYKSNKQKGNTRLYYAMKNLLNCIPPLHYITKCLQNKYLKQLPSASSDSSAPSVPSLYYSASAKILGISINKPNLKRMLYISSVKLLSCCCVSCHWKVRLFFLYVTFSFILINAHWSPFYKRD